MKKRYPQWLEHARFYEVYPQSFMDSNGDGIGDLSGLIGKLDYIQSLHCNAIWLNPCFESPFADAGYDISNYYSIAPRYGTNDDFVRLASEAHKRGIRIVLDLVAGHSSIEHPYFKASCKSNLNEYSHYYVWTDGIGPEQDMSGFRFINGYAPRDGAFLINYYYCQPALNYGFVPADRSWQKPPEHPECRKVREELKRIMKFWLDLGCDGFRVDMASSLIKGADARKGLEDLWHYYKNWLNIEYPEAVLISEWSNPTLAIPAGFDVDFMVHFGQRGYTDLLRQEKLRCGWAEHFENGVSFFDRSGRGDVTTFFADVTANLTAARNKGFIAIPTGNHDIYRISAGRTSAELKVVYTMIFTLPGVPFLYYGDEIGMRNIEGLGNVEGSYFRSAARTPMQWDAGDRAGFSTAKPAEFYLPIDTDPARPNVADQEHDPNSLLNFTRDMLALRDMYPSLDNCGGFQVLYAAKKQTPAVYLRSWYDENMVVAVNPADFAATAEFFVPTGEKLTQVRSNAVPELHLDSNRRCIMTLPPQSFYIGKLE